MSGLYIDVDIVARLLNDDADTVLIDARTAEEYAAAHAVGAINVPIVDLPDYAQKHSQSGQSGLIITMCGSTGRGEKAEAILTEHGIQSVKVMSGGLKAWKEKGLPLD